MKLCPSAIPEMRGARLFGIIAAGRVQYIEPRPVPQLRGAAPGEVFRIAAPCVECPRFDGRECRLGAQLARILTAGAGAELPACGIRKDCRWYSEQGTAACSRCDQVITANYDPAPEMESAAAC